jgi:hypothetical protein
VVGICLCLDSGLEYKIGIIPQLQWLASVSVWILDWNTRLAFLSNPSAQQELPDNNGRVKPTKKNQLGYTINSTSMQID